MRRLIDDKRRNCLLFVLAIFVLLIIGFGFVFSANEQRRYEGLSVLKEMQSRALWLKNEMDVTADFNNATAILKSALASPSTNDLISIFDIEFVAKTRKNEYKTETQKIANRCMTLISDLSKIERQKNSFLSDSTNLMQNIKSYTMLPDVQKVNLARKLTFDGCVKLQNLCSQKCILTSDYSTTLEKQRNLVKEIDKSRLSDGWKKIEQGHILYVNLTNNLSTIIASQGKIEKELREAYSHIKQFPFDMNMIDKVTKNKMKDEFSKIDAMIPTGDYLDELIQGSLLQTDDMFEQYQFSSKDGYNTLLDLQRKHGEYVDVESITSAWQVVESLNMLQKTSHETISAHIQAVNKSIGKVKDEKRIAEQILHSLEGMQQEDRIIDTCKEGWEQLKSLTVNCKALVENIETLTNYVVSIQVDAKDRATKVSKILKNVQQSFPNWHNEGANIILELSGFQSDAIAIKSNAMSLQKSLDEYREFPPKNRISSFHNQIIEIYGMIKTIENLCTRTSSCSNGVALQNLIQRRDKAKDLIKTVNQKILSISQQLEQDLTNGILQRINYVASNKSVAALMQQSTPRNVNHFDLALEIPNAGQHKVEIRFVKGGRSLYRLSPSKKHKITLDCTISGAVNKKAKLSWEDLTKRHSESIIINGNFAAGLNNIMLDLSFKAQTFREELLIGGEWQYQYNESDDMQDNFWIEFWLDGSKQEILWGE